MGLIISEHAFAQSPEDGTVISDETIVVTARRIEERLQDVPISVAVVNQDQLTKANIVGADDLAKVVPGLNVESRYSSETNVFSIRGFSQALRTQSSVGTFFAEVVAPRGGAGAFPGGDGAGPGSLFDLQNVQVLKGPQGTLFGRNTTGGDVLLTPKKPTDRFEGYLEGSYGNYSMFRVQGVLNIPLASWARARFGVDRQTRDGFLNNVSGIGPKRFNDVDYTALRGSLVLDLTPELENYTIVSYLNSDHVGSAPQLYRYNPNTSFGRRAQAQVDRLFASGDPYQVEQTLANPRSVTKQFQVINITKWDASDYITVKNILSYASFKQGLRQSVFGFNFPITVVPGIASNFPSPQAFNIKGTYGNDQRSFVEEFQIQGRSSDGKLQYQGGLYYEHSTPGDLTQNASIAVGAICQAGPYEDLSSMRCLWASPVNTVNVNTYTTEFINMAAYAQATYAVTDQLKLTAGARLNYDRTKSTSQGLLYRFLPDAANPTALFVPGTLVGCQVTHAAYADCTVGSDELHTSSTRPTWTLNASYNPTDDVMFYATYSRGYRQGSAAPAAIGAKTSFGPETVDNFEGGVKTSFQGAVPGYFNLAGFYSKLKDAQQLIGLQCTRASCPAGNSATSVFNAGKAHMWGIEFDGSLRPASFFRLDFSGAYLKTRLDSLDVDITPYTANFDNILFPAAVGDPLPLTPKFGGNVSGTFTLPIPENLGKLSVSALYRYSTSFSTAASDTNAAVNAARAALGLPPIPVDNATPVKQLDLNLDWRDIGGQPIDFSIFASNVTKQVTYTLIQPLYGSFGFDLRYLGQPRMFGARLRVRFGDE
ncbi:TonB-dependent receptor [Novosphingobium sp. CF614]|uniref:TonB-dependent receptor n=1 Tax=Novosphingobium sp. CF614 TaxID=1884364 RepID=UPI0015A6815E|nr:TonB-dependent receptor [Novosphingobium sp. CF614]